MDKQSEKYLQTSTTQISNQKPIQTSSLEKKPQTSIEIESNFDQHHREQSEGNKKSEDLHSKIKNTSLNVQNQPYLQPPHPYDNTKKQARHEKSQTFLWGNFSKLVSQAGIESTLLNRIKKLASDEGFFSPQISLLFKSELKGQMLKKTQKAFRTCILNELVLPIFQPLKIQIDELGTQALEFLYKSISETNEEGIVQFLEEHIDPESQTFVEAVQTLLKLHTNFKRRELEQQPQREVIDNKNEDQNQLLVRQLNLETSQFQKALQQKDITLETASLELIMVAKFNHGSFSKQVDQTIKSLPGQKNIKNKIMKTFEDLFRNIELTKEIASRLQKLGLQADDIKQVKNFIRKNEQAKLNDKLSEFFEQEQQQSEKLNFFNELMSLRPKYHGSNSQLMNSSSSSFKEMSSPSKKTESQTEILSSTSLQKEPQPTLKLKLKSEKIPEKLEEKFEDLQIHRNTETPETKKRPAIPEPKYFGGHNDFDEMFDELQSSADQFSRQSSDRRQNSRGKPTKKIQYRQKSKEHIDNSGPTENLSRSLSNQNNSDSKSKIQIIGRGKIQDQTNGSPNQNSKIHLNPGTHAAREPHNINDRIFGVHQREDFPSILQTQPEAPRPDSTRFEDFREVKQGGDVFKIGNDRSFNEIARYYEQVQGERSFEQKKVFSSMMSKRNKHKSEREKMMPEFESMDLENIGFESRVILVLHDKNLKFTLRRPHQQLPIDPSFIVVERREIKNLVATIIRLEFDSATECLHLEFPKGGFMGFLQSDEKIQYWRRMFSQTYFYVERLVDKKATYTQEYFDLLVFYLMTILNEFSMNREYLKFWWALINLQHVVNTASEGFRESFANLEYIIHKNKLNFDAECSRLFLYYFATYIQTVHPIQMQSALLQSVALVSNFQDLGSRPAFFNEGYTFEYETKLVLYCMLTRFSRNLSVHQQAFCQHLNTTFALVQSFQEKMKLIRSLKYQCNQKLEELYPLIKETIDLRNYNLYEFLAMRLTLINVDKSPSNVHHHHIQKHTNYRLEDSKRLWVIQLIREVKHHIDNVSQNEIKTQNTYLRHINQDYSTDVREILLGKNPNSQNFLFNHELFYDFYSELIRLKQKRKLDLLNVFQKCFAEGRKTKAFEFVILRSQKFANMIAFMCNLDKDTQRNLESIIKRMQPKGNLLNTVTCWFRDQFREENHEFFIHIFTMLMDVCKGEFFTPYEFMKSIEVFSHIERISKHVQKLAQVVILKMKKFPQLSPDLKYHLEEIKDIRNSIRKIYIEELAVRLEQVKAPLQKLQKTASEILLQSSVPRSDAETILKKLFQNRNDKSKQSLRKQIIEFYSQCKKEIRVLGYYNNFKSTLRDLIDEIENKDIPYSIVENMKKAKVKTITENQAQEFKRLAIIVEDNVKEIQTIKKKCNSLIKVLKAYGQLFTDKIEALEEWIKKVPSTDIKVSLRGIKKFNQFLDCSDEMNSLMKIPLWQHDQIERMEDLLKMRSVTIEQYRKLIYLFQNQTLNYLDFKKYFKIDILSTLLQNVKDQDEKFKFRLSEYINFLDDRTLGNFVTSINAVNDVSIKISKNQFFESAYLEIVNFLQSPPLNSSLTIEDAFKKIRAVDSKFKQIAFDVLEEDQEILKTLIFRCKYRRVFEMISEKKIDSLTVLNDLKEYINDVENSILKIEDIKQLQNVVLFNENLNKATSFKSYMNDLRKEVKAKNLKLSENLYNIDSKVKQFEQMIDSSANRETSFKYDLQEIFKDSVVRIKEDFGFAHVEIMTKEKNLMNEGQNHVKQSLGVFTFKKLTEFKDKAILLVSDFERSSENQNIMQQTIDLFKQYLSLYKILEEIEVSLEKAIIYGYNPLDLKQEQNIKNANFESISKMKIQIETLSKQWIQGMKEMYQKSYLLTHFMGPKLNAFINDTLQFRFSPLIKQIVDLNEVEFGQRMDGLKFIDANKGIKSPIQKVKQICQMFEKTEAQTLQRYEKTNIIEEGSIKNKIELITCHKVENYYFALVKGNSKPQMNEILYCQKETSFEEIEVFIKRAIIKNQRKHYFIGAHYLPTEVQLKFIDLLNEYMKTEEKRVKFNRCKLCFIDDSPTEKVYLHLCKRELFDAKQITDTHLKTSEEINYVLKNIGQTYLIESRIPGLGKTYSAEKKVPSSNVVYFPIAGNIHFSKLLQRLKAKKFVEGKPNTLIIQIGHVENKNKLEIFLFQLIFFKGFNFKEFFFLPKNSTVIVEMENVYDTEDKYQFYPILKIIKEQRENYIFIDRFDLNKLEPDFSKIQEAFTYFYLVKMYQKAILKDEEPFEKFELMFKKNPNIKICSKEDGRKLIHYYFVTLLEQSKTEPTFWLYRSFIKMLFTAFKTFSQNGCFNIAILESNNRANRNLGLINVRLDFLNCCVKNSIQFLQATVNTNEFNEKQEDGATQANKIPSEEDFREKLSKFPFLILPAYDFHNYEFVYLNSDTVNISIKSLIISQSIFKYIRFNKHGYDKSTLERKLDQTIVANLFSENSLENLREENLERQIYRILHQISGNQIFNISDKKPIKEFKNMREDIKNYSITLDNFFKMCLIVQRAVSNIPIIIMGESGVGKTALIRFLVEIVYGHSLLIFNIHAGIDEQKLAEFYRQILAASEVVKNVPKQKVWVFFDEFNTTDELSYIKEMIIDKRFEGEPIPDNVVLIGACNPYRQRKESNFKRAGIKKKLAEHNHQSETNLAFKVKPPSLSMIQFMWDYQQLQFKENLHYISKILQNLYLKEHEKVVETIAWLHEDFKKTYEISSVSLRDVTRFKELFLWFMEMMPDSDQLNTNPKEINPNYKMDREQRAISLSIAFCYSLRIADREQRKQLLRVMGKQLEFDTPIEQVVENQQIDYVRRLKIATERIAINFSLRQNVFTTLVCLMNKIPILIIGNPGNSKSLSIRMISSNLRGLNSESKFCRQFPELSIIYFQGSEACTSKGVEAVFQKAIDSNIAFKKKKEKQQGLGDVQNCVLFDEIGLAEKSIHNPLKVLHSKLETNKKEICFIGISNWQLDAAKMSRFLVLSRSNPEKEELRDTAFKILESYINREAYKHEKTFREMSDWYFEFVKTWDIENKDSYKEGFFGLRDFYCYIKYVAEELEKESKANINEIIRRSILTNFDGQEGSVEMFLEIAGLDKIDELHIIEPIKIVEENLSKDSSRSLLLIVRGDALLPIIKDKVKIKGEKQRIECIYGSTFALDQQSEEYNLEMTSMIISHMSRGTILTFKNPNNSIQTSLYDVFNKSFTYSGPKKYCRVAVGANSNPKCVVNELFGSIVFMDEEVIKKTDLAFLNRFEKHFLTLSNVLSQYEKEFVSEINSWINGLIKFKEKTQYKKQEHYLINSSEQSIVTLIIKYRDSLGKYRESGVKKIKKALLKNATEHFHIALKSEEKNFITTGMRTEVNQLLKEIEKEKDGDFSMIDEDAGFEDIFEQQMIPRDKIIFTYDEGIYSAPTYMYHNDKTLKIRISQVKSEKELRKSLKEAFVSDKFDNIHILIDFQKEFQHVNFVAFLITGIKNEFRSNKKIYLIIKLSQTSLENAGREHINISYLLDFEQKFIDSLTLGKSFMEAISNKTVKELYVERRMEDNFDNFYIEAQKRFRLLQNEKDVPKGIPPQELKNFQFGEMMKMHENEHFRKEALDFLFENLSETKIDISIILNNKEDRNLCSSPQESFEKYLQNAVVQQICLFFQRVYMSNLLFSFDVPRLFAFYKKYYDVQIMEIIYDQSKDVYEKFFAHCLDRFVKFKTDIVKQYLKSYNSNPLQIKSVCLLPVGLTELEYISSNSEDSLFKTSSKILELSVSSEPQVIQECQILIEKCVSILHEKSVFLKGSRGKNSFDFEEFLNENHSLQIFYFFDMISKIYSESIESININTSVLPLEKLVYLFVQIFKKLEIKQKIILLSLSKELWSNIFNIWSLWITHREENFHRQMETHYLQNHYINSQVSEAHQLPKLLTELCKSTLVMHQKLLKLDIVNIENYGIEKYLAFFRKTYLYVQKVRLTCMDLDVETSETMKATKRFFDLLDKIFDKHDIQQQLTVFLTTQEISFEAKVERYLSNVLKSAAVNQNDIQHILSYLSLEIYSSWVHRLKDQRHKGYSVEQEIQTCIQSFINYSDRFSSFSNNSSFFLQNVFDEFIENANTIPQKLEFIENERDEILALIDDGLIMRNNFAVAVGNFFMGSIEQSAFQQMNGEHENRALKEAQQDSFIKKYLKLFQDSIRKTNYSSKILQILTIEFMKYYCLQYLEALQNEQEQSTTWKVDEFLNENSNMADTLRLYLLKKILYREQKMTLVKERYLDNKRCKWLEHFRTLVTGKSFELLVPPSFEQECKKINDLIAKFRQEQYEKMEIFEQILKESFVSSMSKYEFLTFMMNDIYTRSCPEDRILKIIQIINKSDHYKDIHNTVEYNLLLCYIEHNVTSAIKYEVKEMELPQKKIEEFVNEQLIFLNYINIFVACNKQECPLIEMFFDHSGNVPENYIDWLEKRFLVNGRENQSVSILKRFIELGDNTPGYYKCSTKCDMFYTIGGSGGFGCQLPRVQGRCGWCNGIIGGVNHVLTRANEGARKVDLTALPMELQQIREKRKLQILNHKLNGYSYSANTQEMVKEVESNRRLPESVKYILQQMLFAVWSFLSGSKLIPEQTIKEIFRINSAAFERESYEIMQHFYKLETKTINLNEEDQSSIVWHLGISKEIMKFIIGYKSQLTNEMKQKMGLVKCIGRDTFEEYLSNNVILKYSSGNDKLVLVNRSRCVKAGLNLSGQQILRQTGGFQQHLDKYPRIRLIKLLHEDKTPCFKNLVKEYKEIINRDHKILAYYIDNEDEIEKLIGFRILYTFITKILKLFNMKVTRQDAQTKSIIKIYEEVYKQNAYDTVSTSSLNSFREQVIQFCQVWNRLRELKFELRYGCHMLGFMNEVLEKLEPTSFAINFFPDTKFKGDQKGEMILSLLQVTAQQYNEICRAIEHRKMGERKFREIEIFNPKPINPTQIQALTKTLELQRDLIEGQFVANFSNWSVEYGCGLPHYSIDKIESLIVENIVGCHNLNEEIKEYDSINFIGEQLNFIVEIRALGNQAQWEKIPKKEEIQKFIVTLKHDEPDSFLKEITTMKGSIQLILHYCRLQKGVSFEKLTIEQFIRQNKIKVLSKILLNEDLFSSLEMKFILSLYQFIELYTLKNSAECLDDSYKKESLSANEEKTIKHFLDELGKEFKPENEIYYHLTVAIYRFVARSLLLVEWNESLTLFDFLYEGEHLWPHKFDMSKLSEVKYFHEAFSITLTKMQSLLDLMPLELKRTKTEVLIIDQKKTTLESFAKNEPEKIKPMAMQKRKKNL